jgi:hypothetical protein
MLSLIRRKIIYRVQHILVPKRQVLFLILTRRRKRTDNIFRNHKSEVDICKKIHLHQWIIPKVSVLGSIKHKLIFKTFEISIIYYIYLPADLPVYLRIHLFIYRSVCMSVYGEYDCLSLPSTPMPKYQSLRFIHWPNIKCLSYCQSLFPSQSFLGYIWILLSGFIRCIPRLFLVVRRSFVIYIDTNKPDFSMKLVICGQQSIFPAHCGTKCLTGVFSRPCL